MSRTIEEYRESLRGGTTRPLPEHEEGTPERLAVDNDPLVLSTVKRLYGRVDDDLLQAGRIGQLIAARAYDPKRARFSTWATYQIRKKAQDENRATDLIHIPDYARAERSKCPSYKGARVDALKVLGASWFSTDRKNRDDGRSAEIADHRQDEETRRAEELACVKAAIAAAMPEMERLDRRIPGVIIARFGLDGKEPLLLREVGERIGVTRETVRQLEDRGMRMIRRKLLKAMAS